MLAAIDDLTVARRGAGADSGLRLRHHHVVTPAGSRARLMTTGEPQSIFSRVVCDLVAAFQSSRVKFIYMTRQLANLIIEVYLDE